MDKITTSAAYTASGASILAGIVSTFTYEEWNAIGVMVGIFLGVSTWLVNLYFKIKDDRRKEKYAQHHHGKN